MPTTRYHHSEAKMGTATHTAECEPDADRRGKVAPGLRFRRLRAAAAVCAGGLLIVGRSDFEQFAFLVLHELVDLRDVAGGRLVEFLFGAQ